MNKESITDLLTALDRAIYHALDRLGLSSPTKRLNQHFGRQTQGGTRA
jgi:hypothetical protein